MSKVSGVWSAIGAVIIGLMLADVLTHPTGTRAAGSVLSGVSKSTGNQLIGVPAK